MAPPCALMKSIRHQCGPQQRVWDVAQCPRSLAAAHRDCRQRRAPDAGADHQRQPRAAQAAEATRGHLGRHGLGSAVLLRVAQKEGGTDSASPATASKRWERADGAPHADTRHARPLIPIMMLFYRKLTSQRLHGPRSRGHEAGGDRIGRGAAERPRHCRPSDPAPPRRRLAAARRVVRQLSARRSRGTGRGAATRPAKSAAPRAAAGRSRSSRRSAARRRPRRPASPSAPRRAPRRSRAPGTGTGSSAAGTR